VVNGVKSQESRVYRGRIKPKTINYKLLTINSNERGMSLVEVLMAVAVFVVMVSGLFSAVIYGREGAAIAGQRARAAMLAKEGAEAVRDIDYNSLMSLADDTDSTAYALSTSGCSNTCWALTANTVESINGFSRTIQLETIDNSTREVTVVVTWNQNAQRPYTLTQKTRLTNWAWTWQNGLDNYASPSCCDLTNNYDGWKVKTYEDYAFVARRTGANELRVVRVANNGILQTPSSLTQITPTGIISNLAVKKMDNTEDIYIAVAYTGGNPEADIYKYTPSSNSLTRITANNDLNPGGNIAGSSIDMTNDTAGKFLYIGRAGNLTQAEFYIYDITDPASPVARDTSNVSLTSAIGINDMAVLTNVAAPNDCYAYINTTDTAREVQVVNCTDRANISDPPLLIKNLSTNAAGSSINGYAISGTDIRLQVGSAANFFGLRLSAPTTISATSAAYAAGATINDVAKNQNRHYAFVASSASAAQLKVIDISTITENSSLPTPLPLRSMAYSTGTTSLNGVVYSESFDRIFGVGAADTKELIVYSPR
jgi:Tfp pilus assembly protein PilV